MLNKVTLIGNLGHEPETKFMASGEQVTNFSLATTRRWKNKAGEKVEETEWHRITTFGKLAEICGQYLKKGSKCYLEGRIKTSKYEKNGVDTYSTSIIADQMVMLDSKDSMHQGSAQGNKYDPPQMKNEGPSDFDDDLAF